MAREDTEALIARLAADAQAAPDGAAFGSKLTNRLALGALAGGAAALGLVFGFLRLRPDLATAVLSVAGVLKVTIGLGLALAGVAAAKRLARPDARVGAPVLAGFALVVVVAAAASLWDASSLGPLRHDLVCAAAVFLLALAPLAAMIQALRAGASTRPGLAGAMAGAGAAGLAILAYALACPLDRALDVALAYGLGAAAAVALGAGAGARLLRW